MHIPRSLCNDARGNGSKVISQTLTTTSTQQYFSWFTTSQVLRTLSQLEGLCTLFYKPSPNNEVLCE